MNVGSMRKAMIENAKAKLANHKTLGQRSTLSVLQVAELLDILSGKTDPTTVYSNLFFDNSFSQN